MTLKPVSSKQPAIGIAGHAGIGHAFSHSGLVQEDSGGFAYLLAILEMACPLGLTLAEVKVRGEELEIVTEGGGLGCARTPHGFTPYERTLMERAIGHRCLAPQTFATQIFGRISGQGTHPTACAFSLAVALSMMDTVRLRWGGPVCAAEDDLPECVGAFLGGQLELSGEPVAWLLSVNASSMGCGPNEDAEGCVPVGAKGLIMGELGMLGIPCIVLECKAYIPALDPPVNATTLFIRWNSGHDNGIVAECLEEAARESGHPFRSASDAYPRLIGALEVETRKLGLRIEELGRQYAHARTSSRKAKLLGQLFDICCHDAGASVFMTNRVHEIVGSGGLWPGIGAILSLAAPRSEVEKWRCLILTDEEISMTAQVTLEAARLLLQRKEEAERALKSRRPSISLEELTALAMEKE